MPVFGCFGFCVEVLLLDEEIFHDLEGFGGESPQVAWLVPFLIGGGEAEWVNFLVFLKFVVAWRRVLEALSRVCRRGRVTETVLHGEPQLLFFSTTVTASAVLELSISGTVVYCLPYGQILRAAMCVLSSFSP